MSKLGYTSATLDDAGLSWAAFRLWHHIQRRAGNDGRCWASVDSMARVCCMTDRKVRDAMDELQLRGAIQCENRPGRPHLIIMTGILTRGENATPSENATRGENATPPVAKTLHACSENATPPLAKTPHEGKPIRKTKESKPTKENPLLRDPPPNSKKVKHLAEKPGDVTDETWNDFLQLRKVKKSPVTETALKMLIKESQKAGMTLDEALTECCARGWIGFKAEWMQNRNYRNGKPVQTCTVEDLEAGIDLHPLARNEWNTPGFKKN